MSAPDASPSLGVPTRSGNTRALRLVRIALPIVVLDDKWLALIKVKQIRRQFPLYGTELQEEDYREPPAHYFGVPAHGVRSAEAAATFVGELKKKGRYQQDVY